MRLNLSEWALAHRSFVAYLMAVSVVAGLLSFMQLGRSEDPAFIIKTMVVHAGWPGATVEDTLKQVTERLERKLQEVPKLDFLRSYTTAGATTIFVNLKGSATAREVPDIWYHVRKSIGDIRHTLPQGVIGPAFNDEFGDTFGIIYGFTADGFTHRELRDYVEDVRSKLLHVADVSKIEVLGAQDERIFVEFSVKQLATLGIDRSQLLRALGEQNVVRPGGTIETGDEVLAVRLSGAFRSEADIADVNFAIRERMLRLSDIATVRRGFADPPQPLFRVDGQPAIGLAIAMREGGDILALGQNIKSAMTAAEAELPIGIEAKLVADQAVTVERAISEFMGSLWQAVLIILAVSLVSLGLRPGLIVAVSIPLTLAIVFSVMQLTGIDMQRISLGALIIALALLVDDAMTVTDATLSRLALGESNREAASYAFRTYALPMLAGTLVTIAGFLPVGFAASSAGEYTFSLFAVVAIALLASWLVAVLFAPLVGSIVLKPAERRASGEPHGPVLRAYRSLLRAALRRRGVTLSVTALLFLAALAAFPLIPNQFFPSSDRPELLVDLRLPQNASIFATEAAAKRLDAVLTEDPDVARWSTYVGRGAIRFYLPLDVQLPNDFLAQAVVVAKDLPARERLQVKLERTLAESFPGAVARVSPLELGPPVGWPVQYRVSGPDIDEVRTIALRLAATIAREPLARQVNFDWIEPERELRVVIDQDEARRLGLSTEALAGVLNATFSGETATQVRDDIYLIDVVARSSDEQRVSVETLRDIQVPLRNGRTAPLSQVARIEYAQSDPVVWRRDRVPVLTVQANVHPLALPETVVDALAPEIEKLRSELPPAYAITTGGTVEESAKSQASVLAVVPLMAVAILTILMAALHSFQRLALVLSVAPLGLIGVVSALLLSGKPLGFVAILGILALIGIITKNAVILIGQIDAERQDGKDLVEAALDASSMRLRPIMLTAISTVLGMVPIAPTVFWGPMAFSIMGGLLVATLLTLVFLPTIYVAWFSMREGPGASQAAENSKVIAS